MSILGYMGVEVKNAPHCEAEPYALEVGVVGFDQRDNTHESTDVFPWFGTGGLCGLGTDLNLTAWG